ncbi:hypothetical protein BH10BAC5_BH10BAC5_12420 [soil metagenome]
MKKALFFIALFFIVITAFIYKPELFERSTVTATWSNLQNLPYTLSHNVTVASDSVGTKLLIMGGIANDTISGNVLIYNTSTGTYDTAVSTPKIPKRLMNGFGFRLNDSIYFGGGYAVNWKDTTLSSGDTLYDCQYTSSSIGYTAGQKGKIFYTANSGLSWVNRPLQDTSKNVVGISFVSDSKGWALVNKGDTVSVYLTTNSGTNWVARYGRDTVQNNSIFYVGNVGWIAGNSGKIKKNFDSTNTWVSQNTGAANWKSVYFINATTGFISGSGGNLIKTTNGGSNWTSLASGTTRSLNSIIFYDSLTGYAVGDTGTIIKTVNGGTSWVNQSSYVILNLRSIEKINASKLIAAGDGGAILFTTNGGTGWINRLGVSNNRLNSVSIAPGDSIPTAVGVKSWLTRGYKTYYEYIINDSLYKINVNNLAGGWVTRASTLNPIAEVFSSSCSFNNKRAFVIGGRTNGYSYTNNVMEYNPFSNVWTYVSSLPRMLSEMGIAAVDTNKIIVVGGRNADSINSKVYIGTTVQDTSGNYSITWATRMVDYPISIYALGSKGFPKKKTGIFIGGNKTRISFADGDIDLSSDVYLYDSRIDTFRLIIPDVANPICHTGVDAVETSSSFNNSVPSDTSIRLYAPGGRDVNNTATNLHKILKLNGLVNIVQIGTVIPEKYILKQNYPNPFNPETKIEYSLPVSGITDFKVFDALGREIFSYNTIFQKAGNYLIDFNGSALPSGIYFYQLRTKNFSEVRKMLLIK